jgi:hypothetical protein
MVLITSSGIDTEFNLCHNLEAESKFITSVVPLRDNPWVKGFHFSSLKRTKEQRTTQKTED